MASLRSPERAAPAWLRGPPFAHRGLHHRARGIPQNSRAAFQAAIDRGYGVELDVQLTADGVAVVFHDETLDDLTDLTGTVASRPWSDVGRARILGTEERIPSLERVLALIGGRIPVLVEIKNRGHAAGPLEDAAWGQLEDYAGPFAMLSYNPLTLAWFARHAPAAPRGLNTADTDWVPKPMELAIETGRPDFISHHIDSLSDARSQELRAAGYLLIVFTVRTAGQLRKARRLADNVIFEGVVP